MPEVAKSLDDLKHKYEDSIVKAAWKWHINWCLSNIREGRVCVVDEERVERLVESIKNKGDKWAKNFIKAISGEKD